MEKELHTLKYLEEIGNAVVKGIKTGTKGEFSDTELYNILQFAQNSLLNNSEQMRKQIAYNVEHNCATLADIAYLLNKYIDVRDGYKACQPTHDEAETTDNDNNSNKSRYTITIDNYPVKTLPYYKIHNVPYDKYDKDDKALMDFLDTIV